MANDLDDKLDTIADGHETNVIDKNVEPKTGFGSVLFQIILWVLALIPGIIFTIVKTKTRDYLQGLEQQIQGKQSEIDNMMDSKLMNMEELCKNKNLAIKLDKKMIEAFEGARGLTEKAAALGKLEKLVNVGIEKYPDLQSHGAIASYMRDVKTYNAEITAARTLYNDLVTRWNTEIFQWPAKRIVAAKKHYRTKIPFAITQADKAKATRGVYTDDTILD